MFSNHKKPNNFCHPTSSKSSLFLLEIKYLYPMSSTNICSICSNKGPDEPSPILPQQLFPKYLLQFGVNNKLNFITASYREHVHFRCAFFIPKLRWVKEVFHRPTVEYVCFGLE